ncbi:hypothetical protein AX17_005497 [Amanita inopinata Kibby_2008]|nr:hypothetical protein AX17_005497 [Amanita inopinata Kibby_2008]
MRTSTSLHHVPLRSPSRHIWPGAHMRDFCPWMHLQNIACLVGEAPFNEPAPCGKGKKRAVSPLVHESSSKLLRTADDSAEYSSDTFSTLNEAKWPNLEYPIVPRVSCAAISVSGNLDLVPIWRHTFHVQFYKDAPLGINSPLDSTLENEEYLFNNMLKSMFGHIEEPQTIDLGAVDFLEYNHRLVAASPSVRKNGNESNWLCLVPILADEVDGGSQDLSSPEAEDLIMACHSMRIMRRATIQGRLKLIIMPFDYTNAEIDEFPYRLEIELNACIVTPFIFEPYPRGATRKLTTRLEDSQRRLLYYVYCPSSVPAQSQAVVNIPFFYSNLKSAPLLPSKLAENAVQPKSLIPKLLPFQRRSVAWLLQREGKSVTAQGKIVPSTDFKEYTFWSEIQESNQTLYFNRLSGAIAPEVTYKPPSLGGILAEEPGLGKTLETIALMLLNPAPPERNPSVKRWDTQARLEVRAIKSTLIVTPPSLANQWIDELAAHAPSLKVLVYEGWSKVVPRPRTAKKVTRPAKNRALSRHSKATSREDSPFDPASELVASEKTFDWCSHVNEYDVVITTYQVLKADLDVARAAPERPRRQNAVYLNIERPRSPLVRCEWYRVVMDEVQMVGGGKTEDMVSLIPRQSSLAVSGTPARAQISDLIHVLRFLRVDDVVGSARFWNRLLDRGYCDEFATFIQNYAIRTLKASVRQELTIPQQRRFLVPIELGTVERHVYVHALEAVLLELGLDACGIATSAGWDVDGSVLRSSIRRLRGICTHPQVGQLPRQNDRLYKPGTLKTMADVLQAMRDHNWRNVMEDWKSKILVLTRLAQLQQNVETDRNRYQRALETILEAEKQANSLIAEINSAIDEHHERGEALKKDTAVQRETLFNRNGGSSLDAGADKGKGKEREVAEILSGSEDEDLEDRGLPRNPAGEEHVSKRRAMQHRLRECKLVLHKVKFLEGDIYHMLGEAYASAETGAYGAAEEIRRELLRASEEEAMRAMAQLAHESTEERIPEDGLYIDNPLLEQGGIRTYDLMEEGNDIIEILNDQTELLWKWRSHITSLLTQKLNNGSNEEADGQEYQRNLDNQGEAETYLQVYAALLADRREALSSERNLLATHDAREQKMRSTKAAKKAAAAALIERGEEHHLERVDDSVEIRPEHEVLQKELSDQRKELLQQLNGRAIKSIIVDLQGAQARVRKEKDPEKALVENAINQLRELMKEQNALMDKFESDLGAMRKAFNQRILYFRQLQEISDSVTAEAWDTTLDEAIQQCFLDRAALDTKVNTNRARYRYMLHLARKREQGEVDEDEETCILCRCDFTRGFITQCAHVFCEGCLKTWLLKKEGKTCPVCRVRVDPDTIQRFTVDEKKESPPPRPVNGEPAPRSRRRIAYNIIDPQLFREIQSIECFGDFGSKVQTLVRHLLYLRSAEPGAKSIVFSAWADSLYIVQYALQENGIQCLRIDQKRKGKSAAEKFKSDPDVSVLLLHGERENAGLNITCASRVFLLESVVHHNFEIQAIARIDRMGQTRSTEVYCYYAEDTVERNILDLAARQGLSLYTQENSEGTLDLTSFSSLSAEKPRVDSAAKKKVQKGDFIFRIDDMLAILFPHMYEEVEYLLPEEDEGMVASGSGGGGGKR